MISSRRVALGVLFGLPLVLLAGVVGMGRAESVQEFVGPFVGWEETDGVWRVELVIAGRRSYVVVTEAEVKALALGDCVVATRDELGRWSVRRTLEIGRCDR